jgi:hypothetical protein
VPIRVKENWGHDAASCPQFSPTLYVAHLLSIFALTQHRHFDIIKRSLLRENAIMAEAGCLIFEKLSLIPSYVEIEAVLGPHVYG